MRNLILLLTLGVLACNEIRECDLDPNTENAIVLFYDFDSLKRSKAVSFDYYYNDVNPIEYGLDTTVVGFGLPLDPEDTVITYYMKTDSVTYNLTLYYRTTKLGIYSIDCGPSFGYDQLRADTLNTNFDSVAVIGKTINKNVPVNIQVYF